MPVRYAPFNYADTIYSYTYLCSDFLEDLEEKAPIVLPDTTISIKGYHNETVKGTYFLDPSGVRVTACTHARYRPAIVTSEIIFPTTG